MEETLGKLYLEELEAEKEATRKCLERINFEKLKDWKPHPRSMAMGNLAHVCADIPRWITHVILKGDVDFATFENIKITNTKELLEAFDKNMEEARHALKNVSDEELEKQFHLRQGEQILSTSTKKESISGSINHLVHHRGQLTVYMRLNDIPVPRIYGPSADEAGF
jgi:uncharacterized damage-inducible protein DinB